MVPEEIKVNKVLELNPSKHCFWKSAGKLHTFWRNRSKKGLGKIRLDRALEKIR